MMKRLAYSVMLVISGAAIAAAAAARPGPTQAGASPRSAKEVRGANPYMPIANEPPARLIVDEPLTDLLDKGVVWIQYRGKNVRILPVFGKEALAVSPRIGHLHVHVDDVPWLWADASDLGTVDVAGLPPGEHKVQIDLVDSNHELFPGQSKTVKFTVPKNASPMH